MDVYFSKTYPRRLEDLKKDLTFLVSQYDYKDEEQLKHLIADYKQAIDNFAENTKLHIKGLKKEDWKYFPLVSKEYLLKYLDPKTRVGAIYKFLSTGE